MFVCSVSRLLVCSIGGCLVIGLFTWFVVWYNGNAGRLRFNPDLNNEVFIVFSKIVFSKMVFSLDSSEVCLYCGLSSWFFRFVIVPSNSDVIFLNLIASSVDWACTLHKFFNNSQ